ncbi:MAG: RNA-binding transcriptional accessory protein, partial [Dysgonamonadaceae bacterium]|nr:RNA-binding transcriptional accessory protein [Dysgonamonadaceae bacterium]
MKEQHVALICQELALQEYQVRSTLELLADGSTIPFISRYRKEATGSLDEVQVAAVKSRYEKLLELDKRRETVLKSIEEQGKLTDELQRQVEEAKNIPELEDLYLPFRPKRKTRASTARERGLEPLALHLLDQKDDNVAVAAQKFLTGEVPTVEDALQGARDIIAEQINEDVRARDAIRRLFAGKAVITSKVVKGKETDGEKYRDYFDFSEPLNRCPSHRVLAIFRGKEEAFLRVGIEPEQEKALDVLRRLLVKGHTQAAQQVEEALKDAYKRLLQPSIETEFESLTKEKADDEAIRVFADNLRQLLLASPLGQKNVLAIDPGFRTGCKV